MMATVAQLEEALAILFTERRFGTAAHRVVVEEGELGRDHRPIVDRSVPDGAYGIAQSPAAGRGRSCNRAGRGD